MKEALRIRRGELDPESIALRVGTRDCPELCLRHIFPPWCTTKVGRDAGGGATRCKPDSL